MEGATGRSECTRYYTRTRGEHPPTPNPDREHHPGLHRGKFLLVALNKKIMFSAPFSLKNFWRTHVLFVVPVIVLFWTSGDVSSAFQSQSGHALFGFHLCELLLFTLK